MIQQPGPYPQVCQLCHYDNWLCLSFDLSLHCKAYRPIDESCMYHHWQAIKHHFSAATPTLKRNLPTSKVQVNSIWNMLRRLLWDSSGNAIVPWSHHPAKLLIKYRLPADENTSTSSWWWRLQNMLFRGFSLWFFFRSSIENKSVLQSLLTL